MRFKRWTWLAFLLPLPLLALAGGDDGQPAEEPGPTGTPAAAGSPTDGATLAPGAAVTGEITFESDRIEDGVTEIYTVNADGSGLSQLTTSGASRHAWSPDGTRIAFAGKDGQIYVLNADGSSLAALADGDSPALVPRRPAYRLPLQPRRQPRDLRHERRRLRTD